MDRQCVGVVMDGHELSCDWVKAKSVEFKAWTNQRIAGNRISAEWSSG